LSTLKLLKLELLKFNRFHILIINNTDYIHEEDRKCLQTVWNVTPGHTYLHSDTHHIHWHAVYVHLYRQSFGCPTSDWSGLRLTTEN
jgi:hypothetical protein